jgi:chromosome segregation ATPase
MTSHSRRDSLIQRAAESLRHSERAERLGGALARLARELADARRQIALLKRENATLRAQLEAQTDRERALTQHRGRTSKRVQPRAGIGGRRRE